MIKYRYFYAEFETYLLFISPGPFVRTCVYEIKKKRNYHENPEPLHILKSKKNRKCIITSQGNKVVKVSVNAMRLTASHQGY